MMYSMQRSSKIHKGISLFRDVWMWVSVQTTVSKHLHKYTSLCRDSMKSRMFSIFIPTHVRSIYIHNIVRK